MKMQLSEENMEILKETALGKALASFYLAGDIGSLEQLGKDYNALDVYDYFISQDASRRYFWVISSKKDMLVSRGFFDSREDAEKDCEVSLEKIKSRNK